MPDTLLFLWAKYMNQICKLATGAEIKTACFVEYYVGHLLRCWQVDMLPNRKLRTMKQPWFYKVLNIFWSKYDLLKETPETMTNHHKMQKAVRAKGRLLPVDLLPSNSCKAICE